MLTPCDPVRDWLCSRPEGAQVTRFEQIGGETKLRAIIDEFVDRVFADTMIGFLFARANKERIKRFEYEHAAELLGGPVAYTGQDLATAHKRHPILGGHFSRRRQILKNVLTKHAVEPAVIDAWLAEVDALREQVTTDLATQCNDSEAAARALASRKVGDDS